MQKATFLSYFQAYLLLLFRFASVQFVKNSFKVVFVIGDLNLKRHKVPIYLESTTLFVS
jgi:hypothetical protein